ncbi:unnamed protein product [Mytilus coruscus]|uniref:Period circadian-like C-terminal domain-containing protein n=1 Tax=Mytilus coruscus TaxID=42192 RepID=A0A6J8AR98_MYTCO|nr:unnamed protein product [Mytilus coruscus]
MTSKYSVQQESSQGLKRGHSTDLDETRRFKSFKTEDVSMLCSPFPMTTTGTVMKPAGGQPKIAFSNMYGIGLTQGTGAMLATWIALQCLSGEKTSSSLMYLLELGYNPEIAKTKESKASTIATRERHSDPPWLFGVLWVEGIQMRYTVPRQKFNRTMQEDRDALKLLKQSDMVLKQMEELKENIEKSQEPTEEKKSESECDLLPNSGYNDSSVDTLSTSSKSSDITPSDSRSTDDKGSSMKESDTQSL